jgi:hypothetical protein
MTGRRLYDDDDDESSLKGGKRATQIDPKGVIILIVSSTALLYLIHDHNAQRKLPKLYLRHRNHGKPNQHANPREEFDIVEMRSSRQCSVDARNEVITNENRRLEVNEASNLLGNVAACGWSAGVTLHCGRCRAPTPILPLITS